jgi:hypothetical protein
MYLYNFLFVHIYELALRSKSNRDMPMYVVIPVIALCFMFNVGSIVFVLQGLHALPDTNFFPRSGSLFGALFFLGLICLYYLYGDRYKKIYNAYQERHKEPIKTWKAIAVVLSFYVASFLILLVTALFKNGDWIFADAGD